MYLLQMMFLCSWKYGEGAFLAESPPQSSANAWQYKNQKCCKQIKLTSLLPTVVHIAIFYDISSYEGLKQHHI